MIRSLRSFAGNECGTTSIEYGFAAVIISVFVIAAANWLSGDLQTLLESLAATFQASLE